MKISAIALAAAAAVTFASSANAAIDSSISADKYTFFYDSAFWGTNSKTTVSSSGNAVTFSDLVFAASAIGNAEYEQGSFYWKGLGSKGNRADVFRITANTGYELSSLTLGATGTVNVVSATGPIFNNWGPYAETSDWVQLTGKAYAANGSYLGTGTSENTAAVRRTYAGGAITNGQGVSKTNGSYEDFSDPFLFQGGGVASVQSSYTLYGEVYAFGEGSSASLTRKTASFIVNVTPVPEPESYALMLAGLALMGTIARRKSKVKADA